MKPNRSSSTRFWLAQLKFGDSEAAQVRNWNAYCFWRYRSGIDKLQFGSSLDDFREKLGVSSNPAQDECRAFDELAEKHGGHPELQNDPSVPVTQFMDFSGEEFTGNMSFAGRILIGADFRETVFKKWADFRGAIFLGPTRFEGVRFEGEEPMPTASHGVVSFADSSFHNTVNFDGAQFPRITRFKRASFLGTVYCRDARFTPAVNSTKRMGGALFGDVRFESDLDFSGTEFGVAAEFENAVFQGNAGFAGTQFRANAWFDDAEFRDKTSFRKASFGRPPRFFGTEIHEDVNFNGIDWRSAERSYSRRHRRNEDSDSIKKDAEDAIRAWDRLALIMSQRERLTERHEFFRLKMRAQRQRDGYRSLSSIANWLFDKSSDYGWGIGSAFSWWAGHIVIGAVLLTIAANYPMMAWNSLQVSFANSLAFLRLGSEGGYLHGPHAALEKATAHAEWTFNLVGTTQAVLGPVLLFLVLLTLRNRFRFG